MRLSGPQLVVLRDIYDLPHEAIAEELGITESAAKVRLHRARKRLRERLSRTTDLAGTDRHGSTDRHESAESEQDWSEALGEGRRAV